MGNSEVGHLNIGAGRVVYQELTRITKAIAEGDFFQNVTLKKVMTDSKNKKKSLHLMGLVSDGGVHSHNQHLFALLEMAKQEGLDEVWVHAFLDGRDVLPQSGLGFMEELDQKIAEIGIGKIATVSGRYYAMDRDKRWEREKLAYDAIALAHGEMAATAEEAVSSSYEEEVWDEFVKPTVIEGYPGMVEDSGVIFFDFRPDRARQLTRILAEPDFKEFDRTYIPIRMVTFTHYEDGLHVEVAFPPQEIHDIFGEVISTAGHKQLRMAETEKYAHVTFFFNGGEEKPYPGEERILIPSPKVATYDLKPEMSAPEVTEQLLEELKKEKFSFVILNFANGDMVGHTGFFDAAVKAIETVDTCVGKITDELLQMGGSALIIADHGNAEMMKDENGKTWTAHTTNPVPVLWVSGDAKGGKIHEGILADIAPTILHLADIPVPSSMTGKNLIEK